MSGAGRYIFAADIHIGALGNEAAKTRFLDFLHTLPPDTEELWLLGDVFDFWFEWRSSDTADYYGDVLAELKRVTDSGIKVFFLKGNHDYWTFGRLAELTGIQVVESQPHFMDIGGQTFCLAHGDCLGKVRMGERFIGWLFRNRAAIALCRALPRKWILKFAFWWSKSSRSKPGKQSYRLTPEGSLYRFACDVAAGRHVDHFIFGHIHHPASFTLESGASLHIIGGWSGSAHWLEFQGGKLTEA